MLIVPIRLSLEAYRLSDNLQSAPAGIHSKLDPWDPFTAVAVDPLDEINRQTFPSCLRAAQKIPSYLLRAALSYLDYRMIQTMPPVFLPLLESPPQNMLAPTSISSLSTVQNSSTANARKAW
ncbi:unnamed protein product [Phytophthora lilii]|uniref:Unnamed protein product n=1 Tax=Phytophthora lilii TaxID=2077276 RepID=A0A9W6WN84_9STRA|nr:unnamed protein product [Phytophthora lilii]